MSHTVHPYSHRLGIIRDWKSRWFGVNKKYRDYLKGDIFIREFLAKKLRGSFVSNVEIERNEKVIRVSIETSRPGMIIGKGGDGAEKLKSEIVAMMKKEGVVGKQDIRIDIKEVKSPESNASIVAQMIADALEKRMPYRRVLKQTIEKVMANRDVLGVRAQLSGRLGGAEIARGESLKKGRIPLQTFRADIDYCHEEAHLSYGNIGIKVWIYRGEIFKKK